MAVTTTKEAASDYAQQAYGKFGDTSPYTIVETKIPKREIDPLDHPEHGTVDGGIETIVVPTEKLPKLDPPIIHNSSPIRGGSND